MTARADFLDKNNLKAQGDNLFNCLTPLCSEITKSRVTKEAQGFVSSFS